MFRDADPHSFSAIYLVCGRTDMRYGIDSLAAIIENRYHLPLFVSGTLFLFCGRRANKIKGLVWEGDGFLLFTKRVNEGYFSWLRNSSEARKLSPKQFERLMYCMVLMFDNLRFVLNSILNIINLRTHTRWNIK